MRVHPRPPYETYHLIMFRTFEDGYRCLLDCVREECMPSLARLSDEEESQLILHARHATPKFKQWLQAPVKWWLQKQGYTRPALMIIGFEGQPDRARHLRKRALRVIARNGGFDLGEKAGWSWTKTRYDVPYLRDYMMDYGLIMDSFETATVWSNVPKLYKAGVAAVREAYRDVTGFDGYVGCHLSHMYETGSCIYFTVACRVHEGSTAQQVCEQYHEIKRRGTQAFLDNGGTLSHHHAVGYEHEPWMRQEHSPAALASLRAVKRELDPVNILNPGALAMAEEGA